METYGWVLRLCVHVACSAPGSGEAHLCFASDAYPFCLLGGSSEARTVKPGGDVIQASSSSIEEWSETGCWVHRACWVASKPFEFVVERPIRFQVGGSGGSRSLGTYPFPAAWEAWSDLNELPLARRGASFKTVDARVSPRQLVMERSESMSAGGEMVTYPSKNDKPFVPMA